MANVNYSQLDKVKAKYLNRERNYLIEEHQKSLKKLESYKRKIKEDTNKFSNLCKEAEEVRKDLEKQIEERDKAITEKYLKKQSLFTHQSFQKLQIENQELEDKLVKIKIEHANLTQEVESEKEKLDCLKSMCSARDKELNNLSKEMVKLVKQRSQLREKNNNEKINQPDPKKCIMSIYSQPAP